MVHAAWRMVDRVVGGKQSAGGGRASHQAWHRLQVLALNRTRLPAEALFLIRHQRFHALHRPGQPYDELLCDADRNMVRSLGSRTTPTVLLSAS